MRARSEEDMTSFVSNLLKLMAMYQNVYLIQTNVIDISLISLSKVNKHIHFNIFFSLIFHLKTYTSHYSITLLNSFLLMEIIIYIDYNKLLIMYN